MAGKGTKRGAKSSDVASKCRKIASVVKASDAVPKPVRSMVCDTLVRTFTTYKEERHAFQNSAVSLVNTILKAEQGKLQQAIAECQQKKDAVEAEAMKASAALETAHAASEAAANALFESKNAVSETKNLLKAAKTDLHDLEEETKTAEKEAAAAAQKKNTLAMATDLIPQVKAGTQSGARVGGRVTKDVESAVAAEFLTCVTRTFSKPVASWGTFDKIVAERLDGFIQQSVSDLSAKISSMESEKEGRARSVEAAKQAITEAEENVKAAEEASTAAAAAAKEAEAAAAAAAKATKAHAGHVSKAAADCKEAENKLAAFTNGALAAFTDVEARVAPPPEPEPEEPEPAPAKAAVAAAMAPAPPASPSPSPVRQVLASPAVLMQSARNLLRSPSPRVDATPQFRAE